MIPYAFLQYRNAGPDEGKKLAAQFKATYSRECLPYFLGLWDTVTSVGWAYNRKTFPYARNNPDPKIVRHAMAIDERRAYYPQNLWGESCKAQDVKQVWFAGAHSDVGGSYPEKDCGLSKISLEWMLSEAAEKGLLLEAGKCGFVVHGGGAESDGGPFAPPDCAAMLHKSLHGPWWCLEYLPMNRTVQRREFRLHRGRRRTIGEGSRIHRSVLDRMAKVTYQPPNLPACYQIEEYRTLDCAAIQPNGDSALAVRTAPPQGP